jgi:hypothetical protein
MSLFYNVNVLGTDSDESFKMLAFFYIAWSPIARENKFAQNRYLVVYLGNEHKFSMMAIQQNEGHTDTVTEVTLEYTFDALSWFGIEVVSAEMFNKFMFIHEQQSNVISNI